MQCGHCDTKFVCTSTFGNFSPVVPAERISNETCSLAQCYVKNFTGFSYAPVKTLFLNVFITPQFTRNSLDFTAQVEVFSLLPFSGVSFEITTYFPTLRRWDNVHWHGG